MWLPALKFLGLHFGPRQFAFTSDLIQHQNQELLLLLSAYFAIFIKSCAWTPHSYKNMPALCISRVKSSVVKPVTPHPSVRKQGSGVRLHKGGHYLPRMQLLYWDCILEWSTRAPGIIWTRALQSPLQHRMEIIFLSPDCQPWNLVSLLLLNCTDPTASCDLSLLLRWVSLKVFT